MYDNKTMLIHVGALVKEFNDLVEQKRAMTRDVRTLAKMLASHNRVTQVLEHRTSQEKVINTLLEEVQCIKKL